MTLFLPPGYLSWPGGGTYLGRGTYLGQGVPTLAWEVPTFAGEGTYLGWRVPTLAGPTLARVVSTLVKGVPNGRGYLPWPGRPILARGLPTLDGGVPTLARQHREYLLRGGRYAFCVHARGLFCFTV